MTSTPDTPPGLVPPASLLTAEALLDTLPWGLLVLDEQRLIRQVNQQAARWCGAAPAALLGQPLAGPALPPALADALSRLLEQDAAAPAEVFLPGPAQWLSFVARRQPGGWVLYGQDVTTQKQREQQAEAQAAELLARTQAAAEQVRTAQALRESEAQYRQLFETMDEGFGLGELLLDDAGRVVDWRMLELNPALEKHTGLSRAASVGRPLSELFPGADFRYWLGLYQELYDSQAAVSFEYYWPPIGRWLAGTATPAGGRCFSIMYADVTERKRHDASLALLAEISQDLVELTTIEETMAQLGHKIGQFFGATHCLFAEHADGLTTTVAYLGWHAPGTPDLRGAYRMRDFLAEELVAQLLTGEPLVVADTQTDARVSAEGYGQLGLHAFISVPLVQAGEWRFQLFIGTGRPRAWAETEIRLLRELTTRIWTRLERVSAETSLAASEVKFRTLFNSLGEGVCLTEMLYDGAGRVINYRFVEVNEVFERQTGIAHAVGKLATEVAPNVEPAWLQTVGDVARTGAPLRTEAYFEDSDRWYGMSLHRVGGPGSRLVGSIFSDITERRRQEANLAFLAMLSAELLRLTDLDDTINALGEKLAAHLGLSACAFAELVDSAQVGVIQHGWHRADVPDVRGTYRMADFVAPEVLRRCQTGEPVIIRDVWADPLTDGAQYAALRIGAYVSMPLVRGGEWCFLLVSYRTEPYDWRPDEVELLREVTARVWTRLERARAEEALRASEEQFRLFTTASADALYRMDAGWQQLRQLNSKGFLADSRLPNGAWLATYVPPADQAAVEAAVRAAIAGRHFFELEHRVYRADNSVGWTLSRAVPVLDEQGQLVEWFGTATDVTARKLAEEAVQQGLQQRALFEAAQAAQETERKRMAESLHNGIGQLLYAIKLRLERSRALVPAPSAAAQALRQETDVLLTDAIRQTRALSHELVPLVLEEFGLAAALQDIGRKMSTPPLILRSHVALDDEAAPLSPPLQMALYRIAQELALNVVKHARAATEASLELETMPGWVLLRVADNGPGFAATPAASPGLGLRSIRDRVALLGGRLESGNVPTGGAYVRIRLPLPALPAHDTPLLG